MASTGPRGIREGRASGQASTEYLVMLGATLVIALVVVGLLLFFPGTSASAAETESLLYWGSQVRPIKIHSAIGYDSCAYGDPCPVGGGENGSSVYRLVLENSDSGAITLTGVKVDGSSRQLCIPGEQNSSIYLTPAKETVVDVVVQSCPEGEEVEAEIMFIYSNKHLSGMVEKGTKKLVFKCGTGQAT